MSVRNDYINNTVTCCFAALLGSGAGALTAATIAAAPITVPLGALGGAISVVTFIAPGLISTNIKIDKTVSNIVKLALYFFAAVAVTMSSGASFPLACGFSVLLGVYTVSAILFISFFMPKNQTQTASNE